MVVVLILAPGWIPLVVQPPLVPKGLAHWGQVHWSVLPLRVLMMGPFFRGRDHESLFTTSNISRSNWFPLSTMGVDRALALPHRAPLGGIPEWTVHLWSTLASANFFNPHFLIILSSFGGECSPFAPAPLGRVGQSMTHLFLIVQLTARRDQGSAGWWANPWTWMLLKHPSMEKRRDWNSLHHFGTLLCSCR